MKGIAGVAAIVVLAAGIAVLAVRASAASSAQPLPLAYGFDGASGWQHGSVKPGAIYFGVGGSLLIRDLKWTSWTQAAALGTGVRWADACRPDCAAGSYAKTPAVLTLSRARPRAGIRYFTRLTLLWTAHGRQHKVSFRWFRSTTPGVEPFWSQVSGPAPHRPLA